IIEWTDMIFKSKSYIEILNMLIDNYKAIYGADLDLSSNTAQGEELRMLASILYDFSELGLDIYNSFDINNAKGQLLDNLVLLSGNLIRKKNVKTIVECNITFENGPITGSNGNNVFLQDSLNIVWRVTDIGDFISGDRIRLECTVDGEYILSPETDLIS